MKIDKEVLNDLNLFKSRLEALKENKDFFGEFSYEFVGKNNSLGMDFSRRMKTPDKKNIKAFLVDIRPFIMPGETINFGRVCNLISKNIKKKEIIDKLENSRKVWNKLNSRKNSGKGMNLKIGDKELTPAEQLDLWLNAEFFHLDKEKRGLFENMQVPPFVDISYLTVLKLVQNLAGILFYFEKNVIDEILKNPNLEIIK